ncbi:MAG: metal ABC transporter permease [Sphaerochaetaceae bacterium]|nr:metal ABC transporter permease [Sphaerochaetaceae bacterium]MDC7250515.1 metal ABC transporter permease [Sphaerochaetaceae bacterium]
MLNTILNYHFIQNAIMASILSSIVCGIIGTIIIEKKLILMGGGIAHTAYGGVGLGYLLNFNPLIGALSFSLIAALGIGKVRKSNSKHSDIIIALFWSLGMALGILFISFMKGYPPDMNSYLFGNILSVSDTDLINMAVLTFLVILILTVFFQDWKIYLFDEEMAKINGLNTNFLEYSLLLLIAFSVVILIRVSGIIMLITLLCAPSATASLLSEKLKFRMILSIIIGLFNSFMGLFISYKLDIASGASIVIFSVLVYGIIFLVSKRKPYYLTKTETQN